MKNEVITKSVITKWSGGIDSVIRQNGTAHASDSVYDFIQFDDKRYGNVVADCTIEVGLKKAYSSGEPVDIAMLKVRNKWLISALKTADGEVYNYQGKHFALSVFFLILFYLGLGGLFGGSVAGAMVGSLTDSVPVGIATLVIFFAFFTIIVPIKWLKIRSSHLRLRQTFGVVEVL